MKPNCSKWFFMGLLLFIPVLTYACPACSMIKMSARLRNPEDIRWVYTIIAFIFVTPTSLLLLGFRLQKVDKISCVKKWIFTIILFAGWFSLSLEGARNTTFGFILIRWFYLPLVIQYNIIVFPAFEFGFLFIFSVFVFPGLYCYYLSRWLLRYKIVK